jgi:GNAT superfamily N-acetyltransferase
MFCIDYNISQPRNMAATDGLNFRLATAEDAVSLERLINTAFRNDNTTQVFLSLEHEGIDVISATAIEKGIAEPGRGVLAVADADGRLVGHCSVRLLPDGRAWFGLLAVDVGRQRRGLGSQVLAWAEQYAARELGARRMEFDVVNTRAELIAWYTQRGYTPTGETTPFPYEHHDAWQGVLRDDLKFVGFGKDLDSVPAVAGEA